MAQYLIGIDAGTTGCKTCIFEIDGTMVARDYKAYPSYYPQPGYVEQKPEDMVPAVYETCRTAVAKSGIDPKDVVGIGLSTQGSVIAMMDDKDRLIRPFVSWQDIRGGSKAIDWITQRIPREEFYQITGDPLGMLFSVTKYLWLKQNEPENWANTAKFLDQQDYFLRLFGADGYYTDTATASRTGMMDIDAGVWSEKLHDILEFPLSKRPEILTEPGRVMTTLNAEAAKNLGLLEGTPIGLSTFDQNCNMFGSGGVESGIAVMTIGTFGACTVVTDKPVRDPNGKLVVKPNFGAGNFTIEAFSNASAAAYRWYRDTFAQEEVMVATATKQDPYDYINSVIATVPPGAKGVTFLPYLQGVSGAKLNDNARGAFVGMSLGTEKAEMSRAVMEGISYEMYDIIQAETAAGIEVEKIRLTGGAANSPLWCQMLADIVQRPIAVLEQPETGCLGAAMYAGLAVDVYDNPQHASKTAVKLAQSYEPNPDAFEAYEEGYQRFDNVYNALAGNGRVF